MTTESERRNSPRIACPDLWLEVKVGDEGGQAPIDQLPNRLVRVHNYSGTGLCLISDVPFELGQVIYFSQADFPSQGKVMWTCQSKVECKAGVQFSA